MFYREPLGKFRKEGIDVTNYISNKFYNENGELNKIEIRVDDEDYLFNLISYKNEFPLILSNVKILLNIPTIFYNLVKIKTSGPEGEKEDKYLLFFDNNGISFKEYMDNKVSKKSKVLATKYLKISNIIHLHDIRRIICFNWLMCIFYPFNVKFESNLYVESLDSSTDVIDTKESSFVNFYYLNESLNYDKIKTSKFLLGDNEVPKTLIRDYFENSNELFYECVNMFIKKINPTKLKLELLKIVRKYNQDYIPWVNIVYERVHNIKNPNSEDSESSD